MEKITVVLELVDGEIMDDGINYVDKVIYDVMVTDGKEEVGFKFSGIREINGSEYSEEYIAGLILLDIAEYIKWSREYDFTDKADIDEFVQMYGFSCGTVCEIVNICNKLDKIIAGKFYITDKELSRYAEVYSDGEVESVLKAKAELEKYFKVEVKQ